MRIERYLRGFLGEERGAVILIVALALTVMMGFLALGVDLGALYLRQKTLQTHADLAAISAVSNLGGGPRDRALDTIGGNGLPPEALQQIGYGRYIRDATRAPDDRLEARALSDTDVNAARVELAEEAPLYFMRSFVDGDSTRLSATATAARFDMASFSLGSRLAALEAGLLNALLSEALGTSVGLDLLDYEALADVDVDLLTFIEALAIRLDLTAVDYRDVLMAEADLADIAGALLDANGLGGPVDVLTAVLNGTGSAVLDISRLIMIDGDDVAAQIDDILPEITVSALDILMASVGIVNADRYVQTDLALTVPGLTAIDLALVIGERPADSGWITVGERGTTLHTAQTRLKLELLLDPSLLSGLGLDVASVHLPVYIEIASATATLSALNCSASRPTDVVASFDTGTDPLTGVTGTHVAEVFLGEFDAPDFEDTTTPLSQAALSPAKLLGVRIRPLGLGILDANVMIRAHAPVGISEQAQLDFTLGELPAAGGAATKTFGSGRVLEALISALAADAELDIELALLGIELGLVNSLLNLVLGIVQTQLAPILTALMTPLDSVIDGLLDTLGIGIGEADLVLHGVACDRILLVR